MSIEKTTEKLFQMSDEVWKNYDFKGKRGIGATRAKKLIEDCESPLQMEEKVLFFYQDYYGAADWKKHFQMNYQLLKIMDVKGIIPKYKF